MDDKSALTQALEAVARLIRLQMTEDEVEHALTESGLYTALGYRTTGEDIRRKRKGHSGIPDVILQNDDKRIQVVVEVKNPRENLDRHTKQLHDYMVNLRAMFGLLTNGLHFQLYRRDVDTVTLVWTQAAEGLKEEDFADLHKQTVNLLSAAEVRASIQKSQDDPLRLQHQAVLVLGAAVGVGGADQVHAG